MAKTTGKDHLISLDPNLPVPVGRPTKELRKQIIKRNKELMGVQVVHSNTKHMELIDPDKISVSEHIKILLGLIEPESGSTRAQQVANRLIQLALAGDMEAIKEVLNRVDGRVLERHEVKSDQPISITFVPVLQAMRDVAQVTISESKPPALPEEGEFKELTAGN
jgi:hypothetical protein